MDTRQPATKDKRKRGSNNVNSVPTHSMETRSKAQAMSKRRKQETDPLKMGHILEKIFSFLDADSIKAARQVNPLWSIEGAKSLITKCYVKISRELGVGDSATRNIRMDKFKLFLSYKSKDFLVIPNIIVEGSFDFELWKYLGVFGYQVKSLKLKPIGYRDELLHNLLNLLPNLKYLNFEKMGVCNINVIISAMSKKEKGGSSLTISGMVLVPGNEKELADMEKLADCKNVLITELEVHDRIRGFPNSEARTANSLRKLLSTSQNVLKKLTLNNCQCFLPLLEFPCMTALTKITLTFWTWQLPSKFYPSFRFSEKVPNLQQINIEYFSRLTDFLQILLENTGTAPSVKRVNCFARNFFDCDVDALFKAFPNTEELEWRVNGNSESKFRSLWRLGKNLKKLTLHIFWHDSMGNFPDLDFLFTGFDAETVSKIKETPNLDPFTLEELEKLRVNPSISNLKELEHLSILFDHISYGGETLQNRMLTVAEKYEISQLPKCPRIYITFNDTFGFEEALDEVSKLSNVVVQLKN